MSDVLPIGLPPFPWLMSVADAFRDVFPDAAAPAEGRWISRWPFLVRGDVPVTCRHCGEPFVARVSASVFAIFRDDAALTGALCRHEYLKCPSCGAVDSLREEHIMPLLKERPPERRKA